MRKQQLCAHLFVKMLHHDDRVNSDGNGDDDDDDDDDATASYCLCTNKHTAFIFIHSKHILTIKVCSNISIRGHSFIHSLSHSHIHSFICFFVHATFIPSVSSTAANFHLKDEMQNKHMKNLFFSLTIFINVAAVLLQHPALQQLPH